MTADPFTAAVRDPHTGRFTRVTCCATCGSRLHERLSGDLVCVRDRCVKAGTVVGNSGADVGALAP